MKDLLSKILIGLAAWWTLGSIIILMHGETTSDKIFGFITFFILAIIHLFFARDYIKINFSKEIRQAKRTQKLEKLKKAKTEKLEEIENTKYEEVNKKDSKINNEIIRTKYSKSEITKESNNFKCPECGSENTNIQVINDQKLITQHHGCLWWLIIGWWWLIIKWLFFTIPALLFKIFGIGKRKKIINSQRKIRVCQECGHTWEF